MEIFTESESSDLFDEACLERFGGDPDTLDLPIGHADADPLDVWLERALGNFRNMGTDTTALFGKAFTMNPVAADTAFSGD